MFKQHEHADLCIDMMLIDKLRINCLIHFRNQFAFSKSFTQTMLIHPKVSGERSMVFYVAMHSICWYNMQSRVRILKAWIENLFVM